jgi:hypothetical protein
VAGIDGGQRFQDEWWDGFVFTNPMERGPRLSASGL